MEMIDEAMDEVVDEGYMMNASVYCLGLEPYLGHKLHLGRVLLHSLLRYSQYAHALFAWAAWAA